MAKKSEKLLKMIPREGFIKITRSANSALTREQRTALIRKGNQMFNEGKYEVAKRIFITTGYSDGLTRLGDYHYKRKEVMEAYRMYRLAPNTPVVEEMTEKMAMIVRSWLKDNKKGN